MVTTETRERIRRNIGRLAAPILHTPGRDDAARYPTVFRGGDLLVTPPGATTPGGVTPVPAFATVPGGRTLGLMLAVAAGTRQVAVTSPLPVPSVLRALTLCGSGALTEAISYRILLSQDADTTATATPSGSDLIEFSGDLVGAEDPGLHAALSLDNLSVEPWTKLLTTGTRVKIKVHNATGGTRNVALFIDLDDLVVT
jgi:hypothetical protein